MSEVIKQMLNNYHCKSLADFENAFKEIIQEIALLGLWRGHFFEKAAFYGGTALRIFYGLDRFSEDLVFSLLHSEPDFKLVQYYKFVMDELASYGFMVELSERPKQNQTAIQSAFIKAATRQHVFKVLLPKQLAKKLPGNRSLKIKFEVDIDPPSNFKTEVKYLLNPTEFFVKTFTPSSLFAGKMHALLCRKWQNRVKGRDWYDYVWYLKQGIPIDLKHLQARMMQTGHLEKTANLNKELLIYLIKERIKDLDIEAVIAEVRPFIYKSSALKIWSLNFFEQITEKITVYQA